MKRTGPTNEHLKALIAELKQSDLPIWKRTAKELSKATRKRRSVNLTRINKFLKDGETALVPGKVLSAGSLDKKTTVVAWRFSEAAKTAILKAGGKAITIANYYKTYKKGSKVRIIG